MGICTTFTCFQILRRQNVALYTKQDFLFHIDTTLMVEVLPNLDFDYLKSKQNAVIYIHPKKPQMSQASVRYATQAGNECDRN